MSITGLLCPQSVNSTPDPCCNLPEWLDFLLRGSTETYADAAFSMLRALAAWKSDSHNGLEAAMRQCGDRFCIFGWADTEVDDSSQPKADLISRTLC